MEEVNICRFNTFHISDEAFSDRTFLNLRNSKIPGILKTRAVKILMTQLNFTKPICHLTAHQRPS